ncbi:carboxypeptidase regulatory-like domain-containing protein [Gynuella sp.]|uniref:carboxypeptidase regulatory-like domain-containing protein n=1 Tax=Gynuella sp. TaxID=2969146 RepID=UPI003D1012A5
MPNLPYRKTLLAVSIASAALAISGCNSEDSSDGSSALSYDSSNTVSSSSGNFVNVTAPKGTITGTVMDTRGNFLSGVTVAVAGQSTTTDSNGQYVFTDIPVTQTVELDEENIYSQALSISISAGSNYLSATVTVLPTAQILETTSNDDADDTTSTTTFVDGYMAQAGTAVLPALTVEAPGFLRHSETGSQIAAATVGARVTAVNGIATEQPQNGVSTSYSSNLITTQTGTDGEFTLSNLPEDSELKLVVSGYDIDTSMSDSMLDTNNYNDSLDLPSRNLYVTKADTSDTIAPFVTKVAEVVAQSASTGMLNDDVTNVLTIKFSEAIDSNYFDTADNSIVVRNVNDAAYVAVTSTELSGDVLTVTLAEDVIAGNTYNVLLLKADLLDLAGNAIKTGSDIGYDSDSTTATGSEYLKLVMKAYDEANQNATAPDLSQPTKDNNGIDDLELVQAKSPAFADIDDSNPGIQQLNDTSDDNNNGSYDTAERLSNLVATLAATAGLNETASVTTNVARVEFTATNASYYTVAVAGANGADKTSSVTFNVLDNATWGTGTEFTADQENGDIAMVVTGVVPGDVVTITPYDDFGYAGTAKSLELADNVPPTTILQTAYGTGNADSGQVVSLQYGDGGEQSSLDDAVVGLPYFDLTPRLLGEVNGTGTGDYEDNLARLYEFNATNNLTTNNSEVAAGEYFIEPDTNVYDATAYTDFAGGYNFNRKVGVAFSEDVTLLAEPAFSGTTSLSNFTANNDVVIDDNGSSVNADLVQFEIGDIYTFALTENGSQLDFSSAVSDSSSNVAASATDNGGTVIGSPSVIFRDEIPALVTSAIYNGREFVITFDKAIDLSQVEDLSNAMELNGVAIDLSSEDNYEWDGTTNTLTVKLDAYGQFSIATVFDLKKYNDVTPNLSASVSGDGSKYRHGELDFSNITNANGASWAYYNDLGSSNEGYFEQPTFAAVNIVEDFEDTTGSTLSAAGNTSISVTYSFTHELDLSNVDYNANTGTIDETDILNNMVTWTTSGTGDITDAAFSENKLSNGGVEYTFTFTLDAAAVAGDTLVVDFSGGSNTNTSDYTGATLTPKTITIN